MRPLTGGRRLTAAALENGTYETEPDRPVSRKELAAIARDAMKGLKLRPHLRLILAELVGCWGERMAKERMLVYPSNDYLCRRTGIPERSLRYGIHRLVESGLIVPKDSANGKRFAIRGKDGELVDAYGFDLTPLYARRAEFAGLLREQDALLEERARVFDEITICRRAVEEVLMAFGRLGLSEICIQISDSFERLRDETPRRSHGTPIGAIMPVLESWRRLRSSAEEAFYHAASGGKLRRHIETNHPESKNEPLEQEASQEADPREIPSLPNGPELVELVVVACSSLAEYVEQPRSEVDLVAAGRFLRSTLGAHASVWGEACDVLGPVQAAACVCYVLELYENDARSAAPKIRNPGGYLRAIVRMMQDGRLDLRAELMALIRRRTAPPNT